MGDKIGFLAGVSPIGNTAYQFYEMKNQAREREEQRAISKASQRAEAIRQNRREARKARIRAAQIQQASENTGVSGSSGQVGSLAAITQSQASTSSYLQGQELTANSISESAQRQEESIFRAQVAQGINDLFKQAASFMTAQG